MNDDERPLVPAQQAFARDRAAFSDLNLQQRFERIFSTNLWSAPTSVSGLGSEPDQTGALISELPRLLARLRVRSLLDAPCGDAGWIAKTALAVPYTGMDIVPDIIANLQLHAGKNRQFIHGDITCDPLPMVDAILCRDCLVHLSFANISRAIANFKRSGATYLITTTFTEWQVNHDIDDGDWRPLNIEAAPFHWGAPLDLVNECCTEAGGSYRDKSLAVWRLADIAG